MIFNLKLYELTKYWTKCDVVIEAETQEEAIQKIKNYDFECNDLDILYETAETEKTELEDIEGNVIATW